MTKQVKLETAVPLDSEGYARTFQALLTHETTEYDAMAKVSKQIISENGFDVNPIRMFSVGAGTGVFEEMLVRDLALKLEYLYALEPNTAHVEKLRGTLEKIDVQSDIDTSFFTPNFQFGDKFDNHKFDLILFSHCLYAFTDPYRTVAHAVQFLKPSGKILIFNQGESACPELYTYMINNSDPNIYNASLTAVNHALTGEKIAEFFRSNHPELNVTLLVDMAHLNVDQFVRAEEDVRDDDLITFYLQAEYRELSEEGRREVHKIMMKHCEIVDGKYWVKHPSTAIILSVKPRVNDD